MSNKKHYVITSITLGAIAASSALLIGLTNMATKNAIAKNELNKINAGIMEIYGENAAISEKTAVEGIYLQELYTVKDNTDALVGIAYKTSGSNMYGKITLIIGFDITNHNLLGVSIVTNEQTYASTLVENYVDPINAGSREYTDVTCGATYGAKLIREMVFEAQNNLGGLGEQRWKKGRLKPIS